MSTDRQRQIVELADRVVELAVARAGAGAEAEVTVEYHSLALTRFANSAIIQNVADEATTVRLRLHRDGRTATGSSTLTGPAELAELVRRTVEASGRSPVDPRWPGLTAPAPASTGEEIDDATATASPADRAQRVRAFVDAVGGLRAAGYVRTGYRVAAFANSAGQRISGAAAEAALDGIARTGTADGLARLSAPRLSDVDGAVLGARAAAKATASTDPIELPPGRYEVVLEPTAVADLLTCLAGYGFAGKAVAERRSFLRLGEPQFDESVSLVDDPTGGLPFDAEGTPKRRLALVSAGVSRAATHDRRTAAETGARSTGHALPGTVFGPMATGLTLLPASPTGPAEVVGPAADSAVAALVAGVRRGILVTDHFYTRCLDPKRLVMTGLTRNGTWLIEHGEIVAPVRNMRFTQAYPEALGAGLVAGIGSHAVAQPGHFDAGLITRAPAVHLVAWNFTGGASG